MGHAAGEPADDFHGLGFAQPLLGAMPRHNVLGVRHEFLSDTQVNESCSRLALASLAECWHSAEISSEGEGDVSFFSPGSRDRSFPQMNLGGLDRENCRPDGEGLKCGRSQLFCDNWPRA